MISRRRIKVIAGTFDPYGPLHGRYTPAIVVSVGQLRSFEVRVVSQLFRLVIGATLLDVDNHRSTPSSK